jgi:hypothetical protein
MKQNLNEKINKTNNHNVINPHKVRLNKNLINRIFNEDKTIYWCQYVTYGELLISMGKIRPKSNEFLIVREDKSERLNCVFICSFQTQGYGFFLETKDFAESLQVYKATKDRDYYYVVNEMTDKKIPDTKATETVLNRKELYSFLTEYSRGIKSFFVSGYDDSIEKCFSEFIK